MPDIVVKDCRTVVAVRLCRYGHWLVGHGDVEETVTLNDLSEY